MKVASIVQDQTAPRLEYDPGHPDANVDGYVAYPNVNVVEEMVNMILGQRAYEANSRVIKAADEMLGQVNNMAR